jgi:hypothetical protein
MAASGVGPLFGGVLTESHRSPRSWIDLPKGSGAPHVAFDSLRRMPRHDRPHRIDLTDAALVLATTVLGGRPLLFLEILEDRGHGRAHGGGQNPDQSLAGKPTSAAAGLCNA